MPERERGVGEPFVQRMSYPANRVSDNVSFQVYRLPLNVSSVGVRPPWTYLTPGSGVVAPSELWAATGLSSPLFGYFCGSENCAALGKVDMRAFIDAHRFEEISVVVGAAR